MTRAHRAAFSETQKLEAARKRESEMIRSIENRISQKYNLSSSSSGTGGKNVTHGKWIDYRQQQPDSDSTPSPKGQKGKKGAYVDSQKSKEMRQKGLIWGLEPKECEVVDDSAQSVCARLDEHVSFQEFKSLIRRKERKYIFCNHMSLQQSCRYKQCFFSHDTSTYVFDPRKTCKKNISDAVELWKKKKWTFKEEHYNDVLSGKYMTSEEYKGTA